MMSLILRWTAFASIAFLAAAMPAWAADRPPNVVFILADDLGYRELGSYGQEKIRTPNLDRLASEGMRLTQHYSGNAVCAPSRCVLMTGMHPGHAVVRANREIKDEEGQYPLPESATTLADVLKDRGYATAAFGKWGLGGPGTSGDPLNQGFERFFGYNCQRHAHSYYPSYLWDDDKRIELNNRPPIDGHAKLPEDADRSDPRSYDRFKGTDYAPDRINQAALEFVRDNRDQPFFLYYPTTLPHVALHVPDAELEPYLALGWSDPPFVGGPKGTSYTPHSTPRAAYAAMISHMDRDVGSVLDLLDELGIADDTIVVFSSDNGTTGLTLEVDSDFFDSVGDLRGLKGTLYEGGIRVPGIVRWHGKIAAGSVSDRVSGFEDWLPTLLDLIGDGKAIPAGIDGISMAPTLLGGQQEPRTFLYREYAAEGGWQSVRVGDWKLVRHGQRGKAAKVRTELFDLAKDPGEQSDLSQQNPEVFERLAGLMEREHEPSEAFPLPYLDAAAKGD